MHRKTPIKKKPHNRNLHRNHNHRMHAKASHACKIIACMQTNHRTLHACLSSLSKKTSDFFNREWAAETPVVKSKIRFDAFTTTPGDGHIFKINFSTKIEDFITPLD